VSVPASFGLRKAEKAARGSTAPDLYEWDGPLNEVHERWTDTAGRCGSNRATTRSRRCLRASRRLCGRPDHDNRTRVRHKRGHGPKRRSRKRKPGDREMRDSRGARDNKLVAEIGERHPPRQRVGSSFGSLTARRRGSGTRRPTKSRDGRVAEEREKVSRSRGLVSNDFKRAITPGEELGSIPSQASWATSSRSLTGPWGKSPGTLGRNAVLRKRGCAVRVWKPRNQPNGRQGTSEPVTVSSGSTSRKAQWVAARRKPVRSGRAQGKFSRRKTASFQRYNASRNACDDRKTDGVR